MKFYKWISDASWDILARLSEEEKKALIRQKGENAESETCCYVLNLTNRSFAPVDSFSTVLSGILGTGAQVQDERQFSENTLKPYELSGISFDLRGYRVASFLPHAEKPPSPNDFPEPSPNDPFRPKPVDKKKRILAAYVVFAGIIFVIAALLFGVSQKQDDAPWRLKNGVLTISGQGPMGEDLTAEKLAADQGVSISSITRVVIEKGVTTIGNDAFKNCTDLKSVEIPASVTRIGDYAFWNCRRLESVKLPDGVTEIGMRAFWNCRALTRIEFPESLTSIGDWAFCDCKGLLELTIPASVTRVGDYAFMNCSCLTRIELPESLSIIGEEAFSGCENANISAPGGSYAEAYLLSNTSSFISEETSSEAPSAENTYEENIPADQPFPETFSWTNVVSVLTDNDFTVGLRGDGTVIYAGKDYAWAHTLVKWTGIQRIEYLYYDNYIVGYKSDGTVRLVYTGRQSAGWTEEDLTDWNNIRSVLVDEPYDEDKIYIIGLKADGTVTAKARDRSSGFTETDLIFGVDVSLWRDVKELHFFNDSWIQTLIGLRNDGTIVATDYDWPAQNGTDISDWNNVEKIYFCGDGAILGVKTDGTVVGERGLGKLDDSWTNIKEICYAADFIYGLRNDGRVAINSWSDYYESSDCDDDRMIAIKSWRDIVALSPSGCTPVGLCADGTVRVVAEADMGNGYGLFGDWNVSGWSEVKRIYGGEFCTIGLREDGSILATGGESSPARFVEDLVTWKDIVEIYYDDFCDHVVGIKSDGTVVAAGDNEYGQCDLYP